MGITARMTLALCAAVAMGGSVAGCGGGGGEARTRQEPAASPTALTDAAAAPAAPTAAASTPPVVLLPGRQDLQRLLITARDLNRYRVQPVKEGENGNGINLGLHVGDPLRRSAVVPDWCQPLLDMVSFDSSYRPHAFVEQDVDSTTSTHKSDTTMALASYPADDAHKVITDLRTAVHTCASFPSDTDGIDFEHPVSLKDPGLGDESVSYRITQTAADGSDAVHFQIAYVVVRTGNTIAEFYTPDTLPGGRTPHVPADILSPQIKKLTSQ